jgi:hypothetical protein
MMIRTCITYVWFWMAAQHAVTEDNVQLYVFAMCWVRPAETDMDMG